MHVSLWPPELGPGGREASGREPCPGRGAEVWAMEGPGSSSLPLQTLPVMLARVGLELVAVQELGAGTPGTSDIVGPTG